MWGQRVCVPHARCSAPPLPRFKSIWGHCIWPRRSQKLLLSHADPALCPCEPFFWFRCVSGLDADASLFAENHMSGTEVVRRVVSFAPSQCSCILPCRRVCRATCVTVKHRVSEGLHFTVGLRARPARHGGKCLDACPSPCSHARAGGPCAGPLGLWVSPAFLQQLVHSQILCPRLGRCATPRQRASREEEPGSWQRFLCQLHSCAFQPVVAPFVGWAASEVTISMPACLSTVAWMLFAQALLCLIQPFHGSTAEEVHASSS